MKLQSNKAFRAAVLAAVAGVALSQPVHATVYPLIYDPDYPPIPGLAWRATAELFIPALCESVVDSQTLNGGSLLLPPQNQFSSVADCSSIKIQNTVLVLYQSGNLLNVYDTLNIGDYLADTNADSHGGLDVETQEIYEVQFADGVPVDFRTTMSLRLEAPNVEITFNPDGEYFLLSLGGTPGGVRLRNLFDNEPASSPLRFNAYFGSQDPTLRIGVGAANGVAEPRSLLLVLGALVGLAIASRRPAAPPAQPARPG